MMGGPSDVARGAEDPLCGRPAKHYYTLDHPPSGLVSTKRGKPGDDLVLRIAVHWQLQVATRRLPHHTARDSSVNVLITR